MPSSTPASRAYPRSPHHTYSSSSSTTLASDIPADMPPSPDTALPPWPWFVAIGGGGGFAVGSGGFNTLSLCSDGVRCIGVGSADSGGAVTVYDQGHAVQVLTGLTCIVYSVAVGGGFIACGDDEGDIHLWVEATLEALGMLPEEHGSGVFGLAIRGDVLVSGSEDSTAKLWSLRARVHGDAGGAHCGCVWRLCARASQSVIVRGATSVNSVDLNDEVVMTGSDDRTVRIRSREGGASRRTLHHPHWVNVVAVEGDTLATGCQDGVVRTFSIASGQRTRELRADGMVRAVALCGSAARCC